MRLQPIKTHTAIGVSDVPAFTLLISHHIAACTEDPAVRCVPPHVRVKPHQLVVCSCRVLERWLCEGIVHDPYEEFMIQEHKVSMPQSHVHWDLPLSFS